MARSLGPVSRTKTKKRGRPTYIDLFSGAGGLSLGFEQAGFKNIFSLDNEASFNKTYRRNF
ncbi:MAG TPA: DNA cytosine methyltransferase, partial [Candidatus Binatia bacterium]|nr:DNA cytosine methyltransferase [Candidatus Binatia bacterium]